jgi:hypothetical protein
VCVCVWEGDNMVMLCVWGGGDNMVMLCVCVGGG